MPASEPLAWKGAWASIDPARKPFVAAVLFGSVYAVLFGLIFPPFNLIGFVLVAPAPVVLVALRTKGPWRSALGVAIASTPMWWWHHDWIGDITGAGMPALVVYLGIWSGLFVLLGSRIARRWPNVSVMFWAPVLWTTLELLRGEVVMNGYCWFMLGEPFVDGWTGRMGVYLMSAFFVLVPTALGAIAHYGWRHGDGKKAKRGAWAGFIGVLALTLLRGFWPSPPPSPLHPIRIGIVQTNLPQSNKVNWELEDQVADLDRFLAMTREVAASDPPPDIIVWPETMFPGDTLSPEVVEAQRAAGLGYSSLNLPATYFHDQLVAAQQELGIPMIIGAIGVEGYHVDVKPSGGAEVHPPDAIYNSAFVVVDGKVQEHRYDKTFLTPFGEVMPYISAWPWLEKQLLDLGATGLSFDLNAGTNQKPLAVPLRDGRTIRIAPQICFEATMPSPVRRLVFGDGWFGGERRADLILQITNDGWFGDFTPGKEHHMLLVRWRGAELNTPVVRVANTGISALIDARGRDITGVPIAARNQREWTTVFTVPLADPDSVTLFARGGWMVAWAAIPVCAFLLFWPRKRITRTVVTPPASDRS